MVRPVSVSPLMIGQLIGARAAVLRQQRRMILDRAVLRDGHEFLRRELQHESHDADIGARRLAWPARLRDRAAI